MPNKMNVDRSSPADACSLQGGHGDLPQLGRSASVYLGKKGCYLVAFWCMYAKDHPNADCFMNGEMVVDTVQMQAFLLPTAGYWKMFFTGSSLQCSDEKCDGLFNIIDKLFAHFILFT